jgi:hypothetical protein
MRRLLAILACWPVLLAADLDSIRKEPSPEKRFDLAISYADLQLKQARELSQGGEAQKFVAALDDTAAACQLALESLRSTGKRPSKLSRQYKHGELTTRDYVRRMENLEKAVGFDMRAAVTKAKDSVTITHEEFLLGAMSKD